MDCPKCGAALDLPTAETHRCTYVLRAEPGAYSVTVQPVGLLLEGESDAQEGRRVDSRPASGGRAFSRTDEDGAFHVELSGQLNRGRANEPYALAVLASALRAAGRDVIVTSERNDADGEDGVLILDGERVPVQIVSVPVDPSLWRALSTHGQCEFMGTVQDAVDLIRGALEHKRGKANGSLLALDAGHVGASIGGALVQAYIERYGDPARELALKQVWPVGPSARSVFRLASEPRGPAV